MEILCFSIVDIIKAHITWLAETLEIDLILQKPELSLYFPIESSNFLNVEINPLYVAFMTYLYACIFYYKMYNWIFFIYFSLKSYLKSQRNSVNCDKQNLVVNKLYQRMIVYSRSLNCLLWTTSRQKNGTLVPLLVEFLEAAVVSAGPSSCLCRGRDPRGQGPRLGSASAAGNTAVRQQCSGVFKCMGEDAGHHPKHSNERWMCGWMFTSFCLMSSSCCAVAAF